MAQILDIVGEIKNTLIQLGPNIAIILIVLSGIVFGLSYIQPASQRGQLQSVAIGLFVGGVIIAALTAAAEAIAGTSAKLLL
ncbi:MAG: hypothetical protein N3D10_00430 [Candidatus Micrarchaeota archaeon]|nr:hypothetical protein [Candidatus Micrarchaeota archaeon]